MDMVEIESIITTWELMSYSSECQENLEAEPMGEMKL
jgi:hypothetical protein